MYTGHALTIQIIDICKLPANMQQLPSLLLTLLLKKAGQAAAQSLSTQVATEACIHHAC
jgi:hypothetical protein